MNILLKVCAEYAVEVDVNYNTIKTVYMIVKPRGYCNMTFPTVRQSDVKLQPVAEYNYLGHILTSTLSDTRDMEKTISGLCVRAHMLIR
jgi:hypothetical protein